MPSPCRPLLNGATGAPSSSWPGPGATCKREMKGAAACWQPRVRLSNVALTIRRALRAQPASEASVALVRREAPVLVGTPLVMPRRQRGGHGWNADAAVAGVEGRTVACVRPALGFGLSLALGLARVC